MLAINLAFCHSWSVTMSKKEVLSVNFRRRKKQVPANSLCDLVDTYSMNFLTFDALKPQASAGSVCDDFACAGVELIKLASIRKVNSSFFTGKVSRNEVSYLIVLLVRNVLYLTRKVRDQTSKLWTIVESKKIQIAKKSPLPYLKALSFFCWRQERKNTKMPGKTCPFWSRATEKICVENA